MFPSPLSTVLRLTFARDCVVGLAWSDHGVFMRVAVSETGSIVERDTHSSSDAGRCNSTTKFSPR